MPEGLESLKTFKICSLSIPCSQIFLVVKLENLHYDCPNGNNKEKCVTCVLRYYLLEYTVNNFRVFNSLIKLDKIKIE